jgi:hypothetical protein
MLQLSRYEHLAYSPLEAESDDHQIYPDLAYPSLQAESDDHYRSSLFID